MSPQMRVKVLAKVDVVFSMIMLGLVLMVAMGAIRKIVLEDGKLGLGEGGQAIMIFVMIIIGIIFGTQLWAAALLYYGAKRNADFGVVIYVAVSFFYVFFFSVGVFENMKYGNFGAFLFFLVTLAYKIFALIEVLKFKISVGEEEVQKGGAVNPFSERSSSVPNIHYMA